jgi:ADP-ribose pyrophosphatase YjhB (NUDIX family)
LPARNPTSTGHGENVERFNYCPRCGAALEPRLLKPGEPKRLVCVTCGFVLFLDPKVAAGCIAEHDGGIILVRRSIEPGYGKWVFPGGYVDRGEKVEAAAAREMLEESGIEVSVDSLLGVYSYAQRPIVVIVFTGTVTGGALVAADESLEARAFAPVDIPWDELAFPSTFDALRDYLVRVHAIQPPSVDSPPPP